MDMIRALRKQKGLSMKELGKLVGVSESAIGMIETGKRKPSYEVLLKLGEALECSLAELTGEKELADLGFSAYEREIIRKYRTLDEYGKRAVNAVLDVEAERYEAPKVVDFGTIRKYLSRPAAGVGGLVEGEDYEDIPRTAEMPREADFALVVSGDSMEPYIKDGEMIFVNETAPLRDMEVGVFCVDGATYVKQYAPLYGGDLMLLSANPKRESANIHIRKDGGQNVQYFGKVILKKKLPAPVYEK